MFASTRSRRIALFLMGATFFLWAYYNRNDPDAALWMSVYGLAGVAATAAGFALLPKMLAHALAGLAIAGALVLGVLVLVHHEFIFAERGREMMGLALVAAGLLLAGRWSSDFGF